jgi:outer membrane receptor for ferrienterochelin and colicin
MNRLARVSLCLVLTAAIAGLGAPAAHGQGATAGTLLGEVTAAADSVALPGAQVTAVHTPTGTRYTAVTRGDGRWTIENVRVGGPYTVTVTMDGFRPAEITGVNVSLSDSTEIDASLELLSVTEEVTVTAEIEPLINPNRTGITTNISQQAIEELPNLDRGFQDLVRLSPFASTFGGGAGNEQTVVTVAGRNNRYNNIQIDGAVNNDLFGLAGTGIPGGQADTQPISLDAIKEIAVLVSPYDVRQGGFSGGGINAITRSGTNAYEGSVYWYNRDQDLVGEGPLDRDISAFGEDEYGLRFGGPIQRDKLFFFVSAESREREEPSGFSADGSGGVGFIEPAAAAEFRNILIDTYGYDPGGLGEFTKLRNSDKVFGRLDWNVTEGQQLTFRHNYIDADNDIYRPGSVSYDFPDRNYDFLNETNSTVLQLHSVFGADKFNEARVSYQTIKDRRSGARAFPAVSVFVDNGGRLNAGTEQFSTKNALDQDILELHDDFTFLWGDDHTITVGTHNEIFSFRNLFIRDAFGVYQFLGLENFAAGKARSYDHSFSNTSDPDQAAEFDVQQLGLYAGDQWRVNDDLTLSYGLRVDAPSFPDEPAFNPRVQQVFGFRTDDVPDGNELWSPRLGFNYALGDDQQLRGGLGIFAGRTPYVWISNAYTNTGIEFTRLSRFIPDVLFDPNTNFIPFSPDPNNQPRDPAVIGGQVATNEINLTDPDFEFPQVFRASLGYDWDLPWWGLDLSVEGLYSDVQKDIKYQNLNVRPTGARLPFDNRPLFARNPDRTEFGDVILLTNTEDGSEWDIATRISRPYQNGLYLSASWLYGEAKVVSEGTSSQAISNWRFNEVTGDPNNPGESTSDFDPGHRINLGSTYSFDLGPVVNTVGLFYTAQSGRPYSTIFSNDVNGDQQFSNDLLYVPRSQDEVEIRGGTWEQLNEYIEGDEGLREARGEIVERNASRAPWLHQMDFSYGVKVPFGRYEPEVTLDVFNFGNLIDSDYGVVRFANFGAVSPVRYGGLNAEGKPIYNLNFVNPDGSLRSRFTIDDLRSRWQAKLGVRFSF